MANEGYHEPISEISDETRDMHRAIVQNGSNKLISYVFQNPV